MKIFLLFVFAALMLVSCSKYGKVKQFATDFAAAVSNGDKDAIAKMYPDAVVADSLLFAFNSENAQIEELEGGYKITLADNQYVIVTKNDADGILSKSRMACLLMTGQKSIS